MSQFSNQSKPKPKISTKALQKSSLPEIDPIHFNVPKLASGFMKQTSLKNTPRTNHTNVSILKNNEGPIKSKTATPKEQNNSNQQKSHFSKIGSKNSSIETLKQLGTADTIREQSETDRKPDVMKETSSQGFDMWNLNKKLKQFSETRNIPFYKARNLNSDNSTIQTTTDTMTKNRTQQIKSMYKMYGGNRQAVINPERQKSEGHLRFKKIYDPVRKTKITQRDTKTYSTISNTKIKMLSPLDTTLYGTLPVRSNLNSTLYNTQVNTLIEPRKKNPDGLTPRQNPYLRTFINGSHLKRSPSNRNIQILQMKNFSPKSKATVHYDGQFSQKKHNLRKNRFEKVDIDWEETDKDSNTFNDDFSKPSEHENQESEKHNKEQQNLDDDKLEIETDQNLLSSNPGKSNFDTVKQTTEWKQKQFEYNRSIERINNFLLKSSEDYMEQYYTFSTIPSSKIQLYIDSLNHPQMAKNTGQYKSTYGGSKDEYQFSFKEGKQLEDREKSNRQASLTKNKTSKNKMK